MAKVKSITDLNKLKVRLFVEAVLNDGRLELIDELIANDYVGRVPCAETVITGPQGVRQFVSACRRAHPGLTIKIEDQIAEEDRVATRWTATTTESGAKAAGAPAGRTPGYAGISIIRLLAGKHVDSCTEMAPLRDPAATTPSPAVGTAPSQATITREPRDINKDQAIATETDIRARGQPWIRRRVRGGIDAGKQKYAGSTAEQLWGRLASTDFINRGMLFAATLLLFFFPFLIVVEALAGRSAPAALAQRLGLNNQAAADLGHVFTSSAATSSAITGTAWVFFILGGIAAAAAIQDLYERAFDLGRRGVRGMVRGVVWLAVLLGCAWLAGVAGPVLRDAGGPVLLGFIGLVGFTCFFWFTMWFLLAGRVAWRVLLPSAVATAVFWLGMEAVFSAVFSGIVISDDQKYGPIGVVFALMSWLIAIGVVIILGAVTGVVWHERGLSFRAAFKKLPVRFGSPMDAD